MNRQTKLIAICIYTALFLLQSKVNAQLRIHPIFGGVFLFQNITNKSKEIHNSYKVVNTNPIYGIGLEYVNNKMRFNFDFLPEHPIGYNYSITSIPGYHYAPNENVLCFKIGRQLDKNISLLRPFKFKVIKDGYTFTFERKTSKSNLYLINSKVIPTLGLRYSIIYTNTSREDRSSANYTNQYHSSWKYEAYIPEKINNQSIITRSNNLYLSLGTTFQFFSKKREYFALHVEFNKGFFTYLDTKIMYREYGVTEWKSKRLYSRGSNITCTASYPITLVNKKGKRRKDRPKN